MKLEGLIGFLLSPEKFERLYADFQLDPSSGAIMIYMENKLAIDSSITLFEVEETEDDLEFTKDGVTYIQLFPVFHAINLIEKDLGLKSSNLKHLEIAQRLLDYRLHDA